MEKFDDLNNITLYSNWISHSFSFKTIIVLKNEKLDLKNMGH